MNDTSFLSFVQNTTLLLAVAFIFDVATSQWRILKSLFWQALVGLFLGTIGITVMLTPWKFVPGIVFDTRSILIGISGLFFGSVPTIIAMAMTAAFRFYQGGIGAWTGVAVILTSGVIGIAWRRYRRHSLAENTWCELYLFGMVVHIVMLAVMLTLPWEIALRTLSSIALPVMMIYPLGTALLGVLMVNRQKRESIEVSLRESEEKYRTLIQKIQTAVVVHGSDTRILTCNPMAQELLGLTEDQLLGKKAIDLAWNFFNDDGSIMDVEEYPVNQVVATRQALKNFIVGVHRPNKDQKNDVWVLVNAVPVFINDEIVQVIVTFIDITDHKRVEEALRESEDKYRTIIENIEDGYHEVDLKGNFTFFNESMRKILGYEKEELLGMNNRQYADQENTRKVYKVYNWVYRTGESAKNFEWQIIRKDGDLRDIEVSISLIRNTEGNPTGFRGIVRDTTDRKREEEEKRNLEKRLNRAEKMEALGLLAGGVAHDLNNVLGIVVGYAEMLLMEADKSSPIRSKLVNIMEAGQKATTIVGDLLTLARRGVSGREVVNLNKIIVDLQQSPEFEKLSSYNSAVKIKTDLEPDLLNISGSSVHLGKTIFNLVSNASEAMKKGGCVTIKTINRYIDKPIQGYDKIQEGDYVVLSVSDTGEGIHENDLKHIFEPFYTKKVMGRSGTGLGLAVVWGTVKDHNGYINVESEEGKGSTFTLYFPVTREELSAEQLVVSISEYMGKGESILVVDDVKEQRNLAEEMLKRLNYTVTSVSRGEEALAYLKDHRVDLLVLDMIMDPGMDGLDTYRQALKIHPKQKAIIVSGFSESDRVKAAQALGAGAYVKKPYVIEKLGLAVRKELDRSA